MGDLFQHLFPKIIVRYTLLIEAIINTSYLSLFVSLLSSLEVTRLKVNGSYIIYLEKKIFVNYTCFILIILYLYIIFNLILFLYGH